jgi:hypothetical protein
MWKCNCSRDIMLLGRNMLHPNNNFMQLSRGNCLNGTYIGASAAIRTGIGIDYIGIAFGNGLYRTFRRARSASGTIC